MISPTKAIGNDEICITNSPIPSNHQISKAVFNFKRQNTTQAVALTVFKRNIQIKSAAIQS